MDGNWQEIGGTMIYFDSEALQNLWNSIADNFASKDSFKIKTYYALSDLNIVGNATVNDLCKAMYNKQETFEAWISQGALTSGITDLPQGYCFIHLVANYSAGRYMIELNGVNKKHIFVGNASQIQSVQPSSFYVVNYVKG